MRIRTLATLFVTLLVTGTSLAYGIAGHQPPPAGSFDASLRAQVIDGAIDHMRRAYIFADVAEKMAEAVRRRASLKEYDAMRSEGICGDADDAPSGGQPRQAPPDPLQPGGAAPAWRPAHTGGPCKGPGR